MGRPSRNYTQLLLSVLFGQALFLIFLYSGLALRSPSVDKLLHPLAPSIRQIFPSKPLETNSPKVGLASAIQTNFAQSPQVQNGTVVTGTLLLTKTIGTEAGRCPTTSIINVLSGTPIYFCYEVKNATNITFTEHQLLDSKLQNQAIDIDYILPPGDITETIRGPITVTSSILNVDQTALWTALNLDGTEIFTATDRAGALVIAPDIEINKYVQPNVNGTLAGSCPDTPSITIPRGANLQHCISITNTGDVDLITITIEAPSLGIDLLTFRNPILVRNPNFLFTLQQARDNNVGDQFLQENVQSNQSTAVTVTAQTVEGFPVSDSSLSTVVLQGLIDAQVELFAGTRSGLCNDVYAVTTQTVVYYCLEVTNTGSEVLTAQKLRNYPAANQTLALTGDLAPGEVMTYTLDSSTISGAITKTIEYEAEINLAQAGVVILTKTADKFVDLVPQLLTPTPIPTPTPTWTPAPPVPTATPTRKPLNTPTPFPTTTPTETSTPVPNTAVPTHTPISPPPTPTSTPTKPIVTAVVEPNTTVTPEPTATPTPTQTYSPTPTPSPTETPSPTPNRTQTSIAQQATNTASSAATATTLAAANTASTQVAQANIEQTPASENADSVTDNNGTDDAQNLPTATVSDLVPSAVITSTLSSEPVSPVDSPEMATETLITNTTQQLLTTPSIQPNEESVTEGDSIASTQIVSSTEVSASESGETAVPTNVPTPSRALLIFARILDSAFAAAAWLWFLCGSIIFFGVAGLIAGLYFRQQAHNRFQLISVDEEASPVSSGEQQNPSVQPRPATSSNSNGGSNAALGDENDHWPASLP